MKYYVAGFLFDDARERVVLVRKNRPDWQAGKLNAVGGHVERKTLGHSCYDSICDVANFDPCTCPYETPEDAMRREFREEAGPELDWQQFAVLEGRGFVVSFFRAFGDVSMVQTLTDEEIVVTSVQDIPTLNTIPNLRWLIPMALSMDADRATFFTINEHYL